MSLHSTTEKIISNFLTETVAITVLQSGKCINNAAHSQTHICKHTYTCIHTHHSESTLLLAGRNIVTGAPKITGRCILLH
jgi:hypothetical protein